MIENGKSKEEIMENLVISSMVYEKFME